MLSTGFIVSHHPKEGLNTDLFWWPAILGCSSTDGIHHCAAKNKLRAQVEGRKTHILWDGRTCPASQLPQKFFDRWEDVASVPLHLRVKALCLVNEPASCAAELSAIKSHPVSLHWAWYLHDKDEKMPESVIPTHLKTIKTMLASGKNQLFIIPNPGGRKMKDWDRQIPACWWLPPYLGCNF